MFAYAESAGERGIRAIIAGAGGAAHLPGMLAAKTTVPVLGVPVASRHLQGRRLAAFDRADAQGRARSPRFAIGEAGAANAALFAASILSGTSARIRREAGAFRVRQTGRLTRWCRRARAPTLLTRRLRTTPLSDPTRGCALQELLNRMHTRPRPTTKMNPDNTPVSPIPARAHGSAWSVAASSAACSASPRRPWATASRCSIPTQSSPAGSVADRHLRAAYDDEASLTALARLCAAVSTEFENVPAASLDSLVEDHVACSPAGRCGGRRAGPHRRKALYRARRA